MSSRTKQPVPSPPAGCQCSARRSPTKPDCRHGAARGTSGPRRVTTRRGSTRGLDGPALARSRPRPADRTAAREGARRHRAGRSKVPLTWKVWRRVQARQLTFNVDSSGHVAEPVAEAIAEGAVYVDGTRVRQRCLSNDVRRRLWAHEDKGSGVFMERTSWSARHAGAAGHAHDAGCARPQRERGRVLRPRLESEFHMDPLVSFVLDAHGGLDRWSGVRALTAHLSLGGPFWGMKGWPDVLAHETLDMDTRREHLVYTPFTAPDRISVFDVYPERLTIQTTHGDRI